MDTHPGDEPDLDPCWQKPTTNDMLFSKGGWFLWDNVNGFSTWLSKPNHHFGYFSVLQQQQQGLIITAVPYYNIMFLFDCATQIANKWQPTLTTSIWPTYNHEMFSGRFWLLEHIHNLTLMRPNTRQNMNQRLQLDYFLIQKLKFHITMRHHWQHSDHCWSRYQMLWKP